MADKKSKSQKKESDKLAVAFGLKDPVIAKIMRNIMILCVVAAFVISLVSIFFLSTARDRGGLFYCNGVYSVVVTDYSTGVKQDKGAVIKETSFILAGDKVGVVFIDKSGKPAVDVKTVQEVSGDTVRLEGISAPVAKSQILGLYQKDITSNFILSAIDDYMMFILFDLIFVVLSVITALIYFLVSPRGAKKYDKKKEETGETAPVVALSNDNASVLMQYLSTDDNIQPLEQDENILPGSVNTNYYGSVRLRDGEVYTVVKKYSEAVLTLEEFGASDMDIIKMNMVGNSDFANLILMPHKEKTLSMQEVIDYVAGLEGVYCIKKRGTLNWVYKYKSKTILIIKENDDHSGFKVSVKVYPDAAYKLNIIYKGLEDSSFPIGPFWYMFNNLRNLPGNVIKWLISESYKISQWQQIRADILRDTPSMEKLGYDVLALRTAILSGTKITPLEKFTIITQTADADNKYATVLETGFEGLETDDFVKEFTMLVPHTENLSFSILTKKNTGETLTNAFCNEMTSLCTKDEVSLPADETATSTTRFVRRTTTVKKKRK